jgi:hypothetical protein
MDTGRLIVHPDHVEYERESSGYKGKFRDRVAFRQVTGVSKRGFGPGVEIEFNPDAVEISTEQAVPFEGNWGVEITRLAELGGHRAAMADELGLRRRLERLLIVVEEMPSQPAEFIYDLVSCLPPVVGSAYGECLAEETPIELLAIGTDPMGVRTTQLVGDLQGRAGRYRYMGWYHVCSKLPGSGALPRFTAIFELWERDSLGKIGFRFSGLRFGKKHHAPLLEALEGIVGRTAEPARAEAPSSEAPISEASGESMRFVLRADEQRVAPLDSPGGDLVTSPSDRATAAPEVLRGPVLGEPYCSEHCRERGGRAIYQADRERWSGVCGACQRPVACRTDSPAGIVPYNKQTLYLCGDPECVRRARELVSQSRSCVICGASLG